MTARRSRRTLEEARRFHGPAGSAARGIASQLAPPHPPVAARVCASPLYVRADSQIRVGVSWANSGPCQAVTVKSLLDNGHSRWVSRNCLGVGLEQGGPRGRKSPRRLRGSLNQQGSPR